MEEVWKDIESIVEPDGTYAYQVSNLGNVRRAKEVVSKVYVNGLGSAGYTGEYTRRLKPTVLKINYTYKRGKQKYAYTSIKDVTYSVHKLVAMAFLKDDYKPGLVINHKDGNKHNNCVENLEWCTQAENEQHSYDVLGKTPWNKGTKGLMPGAWTDERRLKYAIRDKEIYAKYAAGATIKELSIEYNRSEVTIKDIINKENKNVCC